MARPVPAAASSSLNASFYYFLTIISIKPGGSRNNRVVTVEFSDGSSLMLITDYLRMGGDFVFLDDAENVSFNDYLGRELSSEEEEDFRFASLCSNAEKIALRLIARAEQNSLGITAKLEHRGYSSAVVKAVVSCLVARNLLDDERYAELWLRSRLAVKKGYSPQALLAGLCKRGISKSSSRKAMNKVLDPETEYALLLRYIENGKFQEDNNTFSRKAQLKYEGFSTESLDRFFDK